LGTEKGGKGKPRGWGNHEIRRRGGTSLTLNGAGNGKRDSDGIRTKNIRQGSRWLRG